MEDKLKKESEELNIKIKEREEELIKKRKEETMKTYEQLRKKREEDQKRLEKLKTKTSLQSKDDYLYKKLEEKYVQEVEMPMLEQKKMELAKKRNIYKPINKDVLLLHMKKHDLLMAQKEEDRLNELKPRRSKEIRIKALRQK